MLSLIRRVPYWYPLVLSTKTVKACAQNPSSNDGPSFPIEGVGRIPAPPDRDLIQLAPFSPSCIGRLRLLRTRAGRTGIVPHKLAGRVLEVQECPRATYGDVHRMREPAAGRCPRKPAMAATVRPVFASTPSRATATARSHTFIAFKDQTGSTPFTVQCRFRQLAGSMSGDQSEAHSRPKTRPGSSRAVHSLGLAAQTRARCCSNFTDFRNSMRAHQEDLRVAPPKFKCMRASSTTSSRPESLTTKPPSLRTVNAKRPMESWGKWIPMLAQSDARAGPKMSALLPL